MRRSLLLCVVLLSAGCAVSEPSAPLAAESTSLSQTQTAAKRRRTYVTGVEPQPLAHDPYAERPGAEEEAPAKPAPRTTFEAPVGKARKPLPSLEHPELKLPAKVAIVFVREGEVVHDGKALLAFGRLLEKSSEVRSVLALREVPAPSASLAALSEQAKREGNDLLVVLVRSGSDRVNGEAFVMHTLACELLTVVALHAEAPTELTTVDADGGLLARICEALLRLEE